jgi:hypothetical protein
MVGHRLRWVWKRLLIAVLIDVRFYGPLVLVELPIFRYRKQQTAAGDNISEFERP